MREKIVKNAIFVIFGLFWAIFNMFKIRVHAYTCVNAVYVTFIKYHVFWKLLKRDAQKGAIYPVY